MDSLEKAFQFYLENQQALVEKYDGKFIVLVGESVIGAYDDEAAALAEAQKAHPLGTFLVQRVSPGDTAYSQTFHSRVVFG